MSQRRSTPYQGLRSVRVRDQTLPLFRTLLSGSSNVTLAAIEALDKRDFTAILQLTVDPNGYASASDFDKDYLITEFLSKYPFKIDGLDRSKVALEKFQWCEDHCRATNRRLSSPMVNWPYGTAAVVHTARRKIERLLGPFNWNEAATGFAFGPGSTTRLQKSQADTYYKMSGKPDSTSANMVLAETCLTYFHSWGSSLSSGSAPRCNVVPGNHVLTVPKNAKTDRIIAKEPCMNIFVQKGIGSMIRRRLKKVGVNLDDQSLNQQLALAGSLDGSLATLDLSSASDTVSIETVRLLLPDDWYLAMDTCRSHQGVLPCGSLIRYHKFSSMGNGFTFELESLIFWAICSAVRSLSDESDRRMAVYGDDIIVPTGIAPRVISSLEFFGFIPNQKKSHLDGPFRESCGKHYFRGTDVTPIYVRNPIDRLERLFWAANAIKRKARLSWGLDSFFKPSWSLIYDRIPRQYRFRIPDGFGDGGVVVDFDEARPNRAPRGMDGFRFRHLVENRESSVPGDYPILLKALYQLERRGDRSLCVYVRPMPLQPHSPKGDGRRVPYVATEAQLQERSLLPVPGRKSRLVVAESLCPQWPSFGDWL